MLKSLRQVRVGSLLAALVMSIVVSATGVHAQGSGVPVLVMADDEDRTTVRRSSAIFKRAVGRLRDGLKQGGFRMIDEESVAKGLDLEVRDRRSRREVVEIAELVRKSGKVEYSAPAMLLVRIRASVQGGARAAARVRLGMGVDVYDTRMKQFVDRFDVPESAFPVSPGCLRDRACIEDFVAKGAEEAAAALSRVVVAKLSRHLDFRRRGQRPPAARGDGGLTEDSRWRLRTRGHDSLCRHAPVLREAGSPFHHRGHGR